MRVKKSLVVEACRTALGLEGPAELIFGRGQGAPSLLNKGGDSRARLGLWPSAGLAEGSGEERSCCFCSRVEFTPLLPSRASLKHPVGENRRHSRRLGWGAPVSGPQFLAFRLLRGGFLAPVSGGDFPISVSGVQRPVRQQTVLTRFSGWFWAQSLVGVFECPEFLLRHA